MEDLEYIQQKTPDERFQYAFNSGYTLAKYQPEVLEEILFEIEQNDLRDMEGFKWGKWQYEDEKQKEMENELSKLRNKGKDREKEFDINR